MSARPLAGVKVIELGQLIAGPFAGRFFADFGAEVIKVEPPAAADGTGGGDPLRNWRRLHAGTSLWWHVQSRGKKSLTLDLRSAEGQQVVRELCRDADVVIENFKPGTLEKWGIGWEALCALNPKLVMLRLSGYGQTGPMRDLPGFGSIAEAMGGMRYLTGFPDRPPVRINLSMGDALASLHGVIGVMMALRARDQPGGRGQVVDVALYEAVFNMLESTLPEYDKTGEVRERTGTNLTGIVPSNTYTSQDGKHIVIGANGDSIFKRLMHAMGRADLADDPGLSDNAGRATRAEELDGAIGAWTRQHPAGSLLAQLAAAQVPAGKIYSIADIAADPQYKAREMLQQVTLDDGTTLQVPAVVPKLSATPGGFDAPGPRLGQHNDEVLAALGYDAARIAAMREKGAI